MRKLYFLATLLLLSNCGGYGTAVWGKVFPDANPKISSLSMEDISRMVQVKDGKREFVQYQAPMLSVNYHFRDNYICISEGPDRKISGQRSTSNNKVKLHQIYIKVTYSDEAWRYYNYMTDYSDKAISAKRSDGEMGKCAKGVCNYNEIIEADILDEELRAAKDKGLKFTLVAQQGEKIVVSFPPKYLKGYLLRFDRQL
ncbi:MAG: hypothetical protein V4694_04900 [Pseudomonadota bacterium]